jgi:hypothetical protein
MILAETIAKDVNWSLIASIVMAIVSTLMWWDARKNKSVQISGQVTGTPPDNSILARDMKSLNHRVRALENWRAQLISKLDDDKTEVLAAGEDRARRTYGHVDDVRKELAGKLDGMPSRIIADLRNAKGLLD